MITGLTHSYPPDSVEHRVPDVATARAMISSRRPDVFTLLKRRRAIFRDLLGPGTDHYLDCAENAIVVALARMGARHGSFGQDFHQYHNENHALEILDRRIGEVLDREGVSALTGGEWLALALFATCHDLRQREPMEFRHGVGSNEAASVAETHRILDLSGFDRAVDKNLYAALEIMIAGSTFDASPRPKNYNTAEVVTTGGPLAPRLAGALDQTDPDWRSRPEIGHALRLAQIASDLDTANVAEPFNDLAQSSGRRPAEREMRASRSLEAPESGPTVLNFLTDGQERYFFELHRFCSELGRAVFFAGKERNAPKVHALAEELRTRFGAKPAGGFTGGEVLSTHLELAAMM
jgi:hypothetical protein